MMTIELHAARTGNSIRAAIALEEAGIPYAVRWVDLGAGQQRSPAHLMLNPAGKVPVLVERRDETPTLVLSQSNAIMFHAVAQAPGRLLPPEDGPERCLALERFFYFLTDAIAPTQSAFYLAREDHREGANFLQARACDAVAFAETFLTEAPFMAGSAFTIADIAAVTIAAHLAQSLDWPKLPKLRRWFEKIRARPAVDRGFNAFDRFYG